MNARQLAAIGLVESVSLAGYVPIAQAQSRLPAGQDWVGVIAELQMLGLPVVVDGDALRWNPGPDVLSAQIIDRELRADSHACDLEVVVLTDSTNSRLLAAAAKGDRGPRALLTECQLAGRGRRQRQWQAPFGESILMSLLVDSGRTTFELPGLAIAVGATLATTLAEWGVEGLSLKWPNDLLLGGAKLAGVLVEAIGGSSGGGLVVIGVGLNWALSPESHRRIDQRVASVSPALPPALRDRNRLAAGLIGALLSMIERFRTHGLAPFLEDFERCDALKGKAVVVQTGDVIREGLAVGLAQDGSLRIEHADGERCYHSADVSVRAA